VAAEILRPRVAASVPVEAGNRVGTTRLQLAAQHIAFAHPRSIADAREGFAVDIPDVFPVTLQGDRIRLREVGPADAAAAFRWVSDPAYFRYMAYEVVGSIADEEAFLRDMEAQAHERPRRQYPLGVELRSSGELVGMARIGITSPEHRGGDIGYGLRRDQWGRGIATEAAALLLDFGFRTLGLHRVVAYHDPENIASGRVMQKLGMQREGRLRQNVWAHGAWRDSAAYAILEPDYRTTRGL
jgi:RimJ/RimL family protein N-acetyltransferase